MGVAQDIINEVLHEEQTINYITKWCCQWSNTCKNTTETALLVLEKIGLNLTKHSNAQIQFYLEDLPAWGRQGDLCSFWKTTGVNLINLLQMCNLQEIAIDLESENKRQTHKLQLWKFY